MPDDHDDPRLRLIWEEGVRAVDQQVSSIDEVRGRAATVLSAASIAGAFLASSVLAGDERFSAWTWLAAGAFALVGLTTTFVLWPSRGWKLYRRPTLLLDYVEGAEPVYVDEMLQDLARHLDADLEANRRKLQWRYAWLTLACGALVIEILAFLWDLQTRRR